MAPEKENAKPAPRERSVAPVPEQTPLGMLELAVTKGADIEVLERLMALNERWQADQARRAFTAALAQLRDEMPEVKKSRKVDFTNQRGVRTHYQYEDLADLTKALSPAMAKHGLSFRWRTDSTQPGEVSVTCILAHRDGHSEETTLSAPYDESGNKNAIQALGSVVTYLQRYTLKAAVGIAASHDDDGNASETRPPARRPAPPSRRPEPAARREEPPHPAETVELEASQRRIDERRRSQGVSPPAPQGAASGEAAAPPTPTHSEAEGTVVNASQISGFWKALDRRLTVLGFTGDDRGAVRMDAGREILSAFGYQSIRSVTVAEYSKVLAEVQGWEPNEQVREPDEVSRDFVEGE